MKKRLFALLLALCMALSLLPMAALADEEMPSETPAETSEPTPEPAENTEPEPTAIPEATEMPAPEATAIPETTETPVPEATATPEATETPASETDAADAVQALIDALPNADDITAESAAAVIAQLETIDAAKLALTEAQRDALNFARYQAAIAALEALEDMAGASETAETKWYEECKFGACFSYSDTHSVAVGRDSFGDALKIISQNAVYTNKHLDQIQANQTVSGNHTMPKTDFEIRVGSIDFTGTLTIPAGATVTINVGTYCTVKKIVVETGGRLNVKGSGILNVTNGLNITGVGVVNVMAGATVMGKVYNYGILNNDENATGTINNEVTNDGGWIYGGTFQSDVTNKINSNNSVGRIMGGTFGQSVTNYGSIEGGTFNQSVTNYGTIEDGTFKLSVNNMVLSAGQTGVIKGGTFQSLQALNNRGIIENGTFSGSNVDSSNGGIVKGGSFAFYGKTELYEVTFSAGTGVTASGMPTTQWRANWPATKPTETPVTSDGRTLVCWYVEGDASQTPYTFAGNITSDITLVAKWSESISGITNITVNDFTYTGEQVNAPVIVYDKRNGEIKVLEKGKDYTLSGDAFATDVGTYTVTINGKGNYSGSVTRTWSIKPAQITSTVLETSVPTFTYDGGLKKAEISLLYGWKGTTTKLTEGSAGTPGDYIVSGVREATDAGKYEFTVTGMGNFTGTKTISWEIKQATPTYTAPTLTATYGQTIAELTWPKNWEWEPQEYEEVWSSTLGEWVKSPKDVLVGDVGTTHVKATYIPDDSNYAAVKGIDVAITVNPAPLTDADVTAPTGKSLTFNGQDQTLLAAGATVPTGCTVYYKTESGDWTTNIADIKGMNAGNYTVCWYVGAGGNYSGYGSAEEPKTLTVSIAKRDFSTTSESWVYVNAQNYTYDAASHSFSATVNLVDVLNKPIYDMSEDVEFVGDTTKTDAGTYTVTMKALATGNFTGEKTVTWKIEQATAPATDVGELEIYIDRAHNYTFDFSTLLPTLSDGASFGTVTYETISRVNADGVAKPLSDYVGATGLGWTGSVLTIPVAAVESDETRYIGSIKVNVTSKNYKDFALELRVIAKQKEDAEVNVSGMPDSITYGDTFTLTASQLAESGGTWSWTVDTNVFEIVNGADTATVTLRAKKASDAAAPTIKVAYKGDTHAGSWELDASVSKKEITVNFTLPEAITYRDSYTITATPVGALTGDSVPITLTYTGTLAKDDSAYGGTTVQPMEAGSYNAVASTTNTNYSIRQGEGGEVNFIIAKLDPTITVVSATIAANSTDLNDVVITHTGEPGTFKADDGQTLAWGSNNINYTFVPTDKNVNEKDGIVASITVTDTIAPTGKVSLGPDNWWTKLLDTITFGLFFKDGKTLTVDASDAVSGVASVKYYESAAALTQAQVTALEAGVWTELPEGGVFVPAENAKKFVYYIRLADNAGNVSYLSTDGAEFDTAAPEISGVINGGVYYTTQAVTITDQNLDKVQMSGGMLSSVPFDASSPYSFTLAGGNMDTVYTVTASDKAGNSTTVSITMKPLSVIIDPLDDYAPDTVTSADRDALEQIDQALAGLLDNPALTENEKQQLEDAKEKSEALLDILDEVQNAREDEKITAADGINESNARPKDKTKLEEAKKAIEAALENFGSNMTKAEKAALNEKLDRIEAALTAIERIEQAERAKKNAAKTGDEAMPILYLTLAVTAGAALALAAKKKKAK